MVADVYLQKHVSKLATKYHSHWFETSLALMFRAKSRNKYAKSVTPCHEKTDPPPNCWLNDRTSWRVRPAIYIFAELLPKGWRVIGWGLLDQNYNSRWWQLTYFLCSSLAGEMIQFDEYFRNGLKPPTRIEWILINKFHSPLGLGWYSRS